MTYVTGKDNSFDNASSTVSQTGFPPSSFTLISGFSSNSTKYACHLCASHPRRHESPIISSDEICLTPAIRPTSSKSSLRAATSGFSPVSTCPDGTVRTNGNIVLSKKSYVLSGALTKTPALSCQYSPSSAIHQFTAGSITIDLFSRALHVSQR